ncbi:MAG: hypothetical protein WEG36_13290 [Gemmatimonadota bacterium]
MFQLKSLTREGIAPALRKVDRYRLLNEPWRAESICRDVLEIDPENQEALIALLLSLTDQFRERGTAAAQNARALVARIAGEYQQAYFSGIICEREGTAILGRDSYGTGPVAYHWLSEAMRWYEKAEAVRPAGDDDAILRWNACARLIAMNPHVRAVEEQAQEIQLE